jgi:hypothetical protein
MDDLWQQFTQTGKVDDYLKYKQNEEKESINLTNAVNNQGLDNKGTNNRRE